METPEIATLSEYNSQCKKAIPGDSTALRLRRLRKRARDRRPCPRQPGILIPTRRSWAPQRYRPGRLPNGIECTGRKSVQAAPGSGETPAGEFRPRAGGPRNPTAYTELLIPPWRRTALASPACASEITSCTPVSPRSTRPSRSSVQLVSFSCEPSVTARRCRLPSWLTP